MPDKNQVTLRSTNGALHERNSLTGRRAATFTASTSLSPLEVAQLAKAVGVSTHRFTPDQPFVRFEGAEVGTLLFSVRSMGGRTELMRFQVDVVSPHSSGAGGTTQVSTWIVDFAITQPTCLFIPVAPKQLLRYREYLRFGLRLSERLLERDAASSNRLVECPAA